MKHIITAVSICFAAAPAYAQCTDADKTALEAFDRLWGDATTRGDRATLQGIYADDFQVLGAATTQNKTAAIDAAVRAAERNRANPAEAPQIAYDFYAINCTPNSATVTHRNISTTRVDGKEQRVQSRSIHVFEKRAGRWQVVSNAGHPLDDAGTLLYMEREWNDAALKRDPSWGERNYASDFSEISVSNGAVINKAQAVANARAEKSVYQSLELSDVNVRVEGNTAVVTGINHVVGRDGEGKPMDLRLRFTDIFIKRDGRWQVWGSQGTVVK